jgi:hypothetical protein
LQRGVARDEREREGTLGAPPVVVLDDTTPQRDSSEHTRDGRGLVASVQIRPEQCGLTQRMDPTRAFDIGRDVPAEVAESD